MLHRPSGGAGGTASDIAIMAKEIVLMRQRLNEIFARETGQPIERVSRDTERDFWMSAQQAKEYGLVGRIINNATQIDACIGGLRLASLLQTRSDEHTSVLPTL